MIRLVADGVSINWFIKLAKVWHYLEVSEPSHLPVSDDSFDRVNHPGGFVLSLATKRITSLLLQVGSDLCCAIIHVLC